MQRRLLHLGRGARHALASEGLFGTKPEASVRLLSISFPAREEAGGWMPGWLKSKLPGVLGGTREYDELEDLTLDSYATNLKRARTLGGLTGFVHGTAKINDPTAQGSLRMYEQIIGQMTPEEKTDLRLFGRAARERVAAAVGCRVAQVDDCIAKYLWLKNMTSKMAQLKKQGKEMPKSVEEVEQAMGNWRQFKTDTGGSGEGAPTVPYDQRGPGGGPCPLAGSEAGRNTKCPLTRKAFKSCCGKKLLK